jgi:hypothetical protein
MLTQRALPQKRMEPAASSLARKTASTNRTITLTEFLAPTRNPAAVLASNEESLAEPPQ